MYGSKIEDIIKEKGIIKDGELLDKLENPVTRSLYLYLELARPRTIRIANFRGEAFKEKSASCRILMIMATIELESIGYLKDSIHRSDRIELIYS
ncbi:MAG: hypothetical protein Q8930_20955 [Bacillota bacterium]|nr:hypothetical protein [Bacillota bacterium]